MVVGGGAGDEDRLEGDEGAAPAVAAAGANDGC